MNKNQYIATFIASYIASSLHSPFGYISNVEKEKFGHRHMEAYDKALIAWNALVTRSPELIKE